MQCEGACWLFGGIGVSPVGGGGVGLNEKRGSSPVTYQKGLWINRHPAFFLPLLRVQVGSLLRNTKNPHAEWVWVAHAASISFLPQCA